MPIEPVPRANWVLQKVTSAVQEAKLWPVRLAHLKHQSALNAFEIAVQVLVKPI